MQHLPNLYRAELDRLTIEKLLAADMETDSLDEKDIGVPDTPSVVYLDLPQEHNGDDLSWSLSKKQQWASRWGTVYDFRPSEGLSWPITTYTLYMKWTEDGDEHSRSQPIKNPTDKEILTSAKSLVESKEVDFRNLLLDKGDIKICPKPKK